VAAVSVLSRSAVDETRQQYPDRARFVQALDATYVVEGSVQAVADRLRVTLTLVRDDSSVAWGDTVEGPAKDLFALQTELATSLTNAIADQTSSSDRVQPAAPTTSSEPAQIAYWKGRAYLDRRDIAGNPQLALKEFEDAIKADPKFAMGYAGLAEAQWTMWSNTNDKSWADSAIRSTATARQLEPDRPAGPENAEGRSHHAEQRPAVESVRHRHRQGRLSVGRASPYEHRGACRSEDARPHVVQAGARDVALAADRSDA
jgi:hypothetical protein